MLLTRAALTAWACPDAESFLSHLSPALTTVHCLGQTAKKSNDILAEVSLLWSGLAFSKLCFLVFHIA